MQEDPNTNKDTTPSRKGVYVKHDGDIYIQAIQGRPSLWKRLRDKIKSLFCKDHHK